MMNRTITRFAPSPTGRLHLGHAYAALLAYGTAKDEGGDFILRLEDIDTGRCQPEFEAGIFEDLAWLGLDWPLPVRRQSGHFADYGAALATLEELGVIYPCFCTRKDIALEIERSSNAPHGPEGQLYPGICRHLSASEKKARIVGGQAYVKRLDVEKARGMVGQPLFWTDRSAGRIEARPQDLGDVVLARKNIPASYHLAVALDDHIQGVTLVTRGRDLFHATHIHRLLQALLGLDTPDYRHHPLLLDSFGRRFAKRNQSVTLAALRNSGATPAEIRQMIKKAITSPSSDVKDPKALYTASLKLT